MLVSETLCDVKTTTSDSSIETIPGARMKIPVINLFDEDWIIQAYLHGINLPGNESEDSSVKSLVNANSDSKLSF